MRFRWNSVFCLIRSLLFIERAVACFHCLYDVLGCATLESHCTAAMLSSTLRWILPLNYISSFWAGGHFSFEPEHPHPPFLEGEIEGVKLGHFFFFKARTRRVNMHPLQGSRWISDVWYIALCFSVVGDNDVTRDWLWCHSWLDHETNHSFFKHHQAFKYVNSIAFFNFNLIALHT